MNSVVRVDHNLQEFNYLNDQETRGFLDNYSLCHGGGSSIGEFDPLSDPFFEPWLLPTQHDNIPELSLEDIEEITRSLDADHEHLSTFQQGSNTLVGATPSMMETQPQFSHEQNSFVNAANLTMTTTQSHYPHQQNAVVDAMPVYSTITHHEPQFFQTHYGRSVYEMTTYDQPQYININQYVDDSGSDNVVLNSMNFKDDYAGFSLHLENILEAKPISMIPSASHVQQRVNVSAANNSGEVKDAMNLKSVKNSNINAVVKYEGGVVLRQQARCKPSALELDEIRKYFHLPITRAAKELNVGITVLKKRCRELNIMRWPHRKIRSLQCLIANVKEMGMGNKKEIEELEEHKRMLERVPELELSESTKRLRQSCFKANYKKRRMLLSSASARH